MAGLNAESERSVADGVGDMPTPAAAAARAGGGHPAGAAAPGASVDAPVPTPRGFARGALAWIDENAESAVILVAYTTMAGIIVYSVIERFVLGTQIPWSTSVPIYLFLWVAWIGCSYNVRKRTHLVFNDVRLRLPYAGQYVLMWFDAILWWTFAAIVLRYSWEQTMLARQNFAIVGGTDDIMQWWFYLAIPVAWTLLCVRVLQNLLDDRRRFRNREPFLVDIQSIGK